MQLFMLFIFGFLFDGISSKPLLSPVDQCISLIRENIAGKNVSRSLGGIVGVGWDDLTNTDTLPVLSMSYKNCLTVPDGNFLIPDNVIAIPKKSVTISKSASTFESFSEVKSTESESISTSAGGGFMGFSASASFSTEMQQTKSHMKSSTQTMVQKKIEFYAFDMIATEESGFHESFTAKLIEIANAIKDSNPMFAQYKAESLINEYGTHVIIKAQAGGRVILRTFITFSSEESKKSESKEVTASVSAEGFGAKVSASGGSGKTDNQTNASSNYTRETFIITKGGPDIDRLLSAGDNDDMLKMDSLVGLKEEGVYLYSLIHPGVLDGYDESTMQILHDLIYNATSEYYIHNTILGCTNSSEPNFNYRVCFADNTWAFNFNVQIANVADGSCGNGDVFAFGGVCQKCEYVRSASEINQNEGDGPECEKYKLQNPYAAENETCPPGFEQVHIKVIWKVSTERKRNVTKEDCNFPFSIFGCKTTVVEYPITDQIKISTFWCKAPLAAIADDKKVMFGGIFEVDNIFSDDVGCPVGFSEYPFLHTLKICMGQYNVEMDTVAFGGIIDCQSKKKDCEKGFSKHLAAIIDNCAYFYCARILKSDGLKTLPKLSRPPYTDRSIAMSQTRAKFQQTVEIFKAKAEEAKKEQQHNPPKNG